MVKKEYAAFAQVKTTEKSDVFADLVTDIYARLVA